MMVDDATAERLSKRLRDSMEQLIGAEIRMQGLREGRGDAMLAAYEEGMWMEDIASVCGCSVQLVKIELRKARERRKAREEMV